MTCLLLLLTLATAGQSQSVPRDKAQLPTEERIALRAALERVARESTGVVQLHARSGFYVPAAKQDGVLAAAAVQPAASPTK